MWLIVHVSLFMHHGVRTLFDSTGYIKAADFLIEHGKLEDIHLFFYAVPVGCIAFFRILFPGEIIPFLIFQSVISGIAVVALYRVAERIFNNAFAGLLAGTIFLVWIDNIHWNVAVMTESLFCSFICFILYQLVYAPSTPKSFFLLIISSVITFFIRPTGIVVIVGVIAFLVQYHWAYVVRKPFLKIIILFSVITSSLIGAYLMFLHWDFTGQYEKGNIVTYMDGINGNSFYDARLQVDTQGVKFAPANEHPIYKIVFFIFHNPGHFSRAAGLKVWYLVSAVRPYYSTAHNVYSLVWVSLIYFASYLGWKRMSNNAVKAFILVVILVNCLLIGISTVDWDNRFYIPMEPGIVVLSAGGFVYLFKLIKLRIR